MPGISYPLYKRVAGLGAILVIAFHNCDARSQPAGADDPVRIETVDGVIDLHIDNARLTVSRQDITHWTQTAARAVTAYLGAYPVPKVDVYVREDDDTSDITGVEFSGTRIVVGPLTRSHLCQARRWLGDDPRDVPSRLADVARMMRNGRPKAYPIISSRSPAPASARSRPSASGANSPATCPKASLNPATMAWITPTPGPAPTGAARSSGSWPTSRSASKPPGKKSLAGALHAILLAGGNGTADWPLQRVLDIGDTATGTRVLNQLHNEFGPKPAIPDLEKLWKELGVIPHNGHGYVRRPRPPRSHPPRHHATNRAAPLTNRDARCYLPLAPRAAAGFSHGIQRTLAMAKVKLLKSRSQVNPADCWNLESLFPSDKAWESAFEKWSKQTDRYAAFRGKLGESPKSLAACLSFDANFDREGERLGTYAFLKTTEDQGNSDYQRMSGRYQHIATKSSEAASFVRPEVLAIPAKTMAKFLAAPELKPWRLGLERMLRYRPHTLGKKEENLLAMQGQMSEASNQAFRQLNDADLKWPAIHNEKGEKVELGHSSFSAFLHSPKRSVRKEAFHTYYAGYEQHKNTIAATLNGSVQRDVYYAPRP